MAKVGIINYGLGNLRSVQNAIEFLDGDAFIAETPKDLKQSSHAILPGVGAFGDGMDYLNSNGWFEAIHEYACSQKKPFLGICLGMQLLADSSTEHGHHKGLSLIAGSVDRLTKVDQLRIPHVGWNEVDVKDSQTYKDLDAKPDYYFVHSYVFKPENDNSISGLCSYGTDFVASVEQDNIWGTQFHPEKSQKAGLHILKNFMAL